MNFKEAAIYSSNIYYEYLTKIKGSIIKYRIEKREISNVYCYLYPTNNIKLFDDLQLKINSNIFSNEQYKILEYDYDLKRLKIAPELRVKEFLISAKPSEVELVVDLRFLVKNVRKFYVHYGNMLKMPTNVNNVNYIEDKRLNDKPSEEQANAVCGALSNPLTYIWGAPGTGKTRFVLARCVLSYLLSNDKVKILITAPTNNAVEQTLLGVLPVLSACGIDEKTIFRMGAPSSKFKQKYPNCCEYGNAEAKLEKNQKQIEKNKADIEDTKYKLSLFPEYKKAIEFEEQLTACQTELPQLFSEMLRQYETSEEYENKVLTIRGKITYIETLLSKLEQEKKFSTSCVKLLTDLVNKYSHGIRKLLFKRRIEEYTSLLNSYIKKHDSVDADITINTMNLQYLKFDNDVLSYQIKECKNNFSQLLEEAIDKTKFWTRVNNIVRTTNFNNIKYSIDLFNQEIQKGIASLEKRKERYTPIQNITEDELYAQLAILEDKEKELLAKNKEILALTPGARLASCRVLAATIDSCISRVTPENSFKPDHIFLDEAGYCSLIKGVTLLTYNCPITLLGDHMQLPPICEMDDYKFIGDDRLVALYAQSTLHIEEYTLSPLEIVTNYLVHKVPQFNHLVNYNLNHTFRFGEKLANVLAEYVYTPDFHGTEENNTDIYYINSPKVDPAKPRYSSTEIENINKYLRKYKNEIIGIITPYRNQKNELLKALPKTAEILTVHGSQGREWNTVLLSVVDSTNKWFTNSHNNISNGLKVINTAVSRAKNKLVIVCDVEHWRKQDNQLIGQLIQIGEELIIEE